MIVRKLIIFPLLALLLFVQALPVSAHVFLLDGEIEVFSHIEPDDDPIAKSSAEFFLLFTDAKDRFAPEKCDCLVTITDSAGKLLYSEKIFDQRNPQKSDDASFKFSFPGKGVYDLMVKGDPKDRGAFQNFEVHRIIRVDKEVSFEQKVLVEGKNLLNAAILLSALALIVFLFVSETKQSKKKSKGFLRGDLLIFAALLSAGALFFHEAHAMDLLGDEHCFEEHPCCATVPAIFGTAVSAPEAKLSFISEFKAAQNETLVSRESKSVKNNSPPLA